MTATTEDWEPAAIEKAEVVDGEAILTVPATSEKGFMILKSKGAAPSNNEEPPHNRLTLSMLRHSVVEITLGNLV